MPDEPIQGVVRNHKALKADFRPGFVHGEMEHHDANFIANFFNEFTVKGGTLYLNADGRSCHLEIEGSDDAAEYSFKVTGIGQTSATVAAGYAQYGANTAQLFAATVLPVSSNTRIYITLNINTGAWIGPRSTGSSNSDPIDTSSMQYYMIANITTVGGVITAIHQRTLGDIYESKV